MESSLGILSRSLFESDPRIAVFDVGVRESSGLWFLRDIYIPMREIIDIFKSDDNFVINDQVVIPLHELDSAELTGEYVVVISDDSSEHVAFYDFHSQKPMRVPVDTFGRCVPSLRCRYWHPEYRPSETPSYLSEYYRAVDEEERRSASVEPASSDGASSFLEEVKMFIERERDEYRSSRWEQYEAQQLSQFIESYGGLGNLRPGGRRVDRDAGQICLLRLPDSLETEGTDGRSILRDAGLFEGSEVLIDCVSEREGFPVEGVIEGVSSTGIELSVRWSSSTNHGAAESAFDADSERKFIVGELLNPTTFDRQQQAVDTIVSDERKKTVLVGDQSLAFEEIHQLGQVSRRLNEYQRRAVRRALGASDVALIHGPPGSGKTRVLRALIQEAVMDGDKVLACAHSNQAIDNLLVGSSSIERVDSESLHASAQNGEFMLSREGNNSANPVVETYYSDVESWEANVVGATTSASFECRVDEFDLVVIDEASQCSIPSSLIPFSRGKKLVLAGDHKQLPPYTSSEDADREEMEVSLFDHFVRVYGEDITTLLRKQYRMNRQIAAFSNRAFYDGKLMHGQRNRDWAINDLDPLVGIDVQGEESRTPGGSYYNNAEVEVVRGEVDRLLQSGTPASQIGVITPYSGQVGKITQSLSDNGVSDRITVNTVDGFQGSERDAIVVSFVRSNPEGNIGFLGFPDEGPRRLNVSLTRAKKRCTLVGDWRTLASEGESSDRSGSGQWVYRELFEWLQQKGVLREQQVVR